MTATDRPLATSALSWLLGHAVRLRLYVAPVIGSLACTFAYFEPTTWRRVGCVCAATTMLTLSYVEWLRLRRYGLQVVQLPLNILITVLAQLILGSVSGGVFSPMLLLLIPMSVLTGLFGERRTLLALLGLAVPWLFTMAWIHSQGSLMPVLFGGPQPIEHSIAPWIAATMLSMLMNMTGRAGLALQRVLEGLFHEATAERDRSLALHAEQGRTLSVLMSEIAHELKNPLASIKGLGALVAKDLEGRTAERMTVLRGEVDRMQTILEEFLTLSRPLVPLVIAETDLRELCREVLRLHEGSANERGVKLELLGERTPLRCDPRKVRQVLINLVQNALHASPRGGSVTLRVEAGAETRVLVIDQGPGLPPEMLDRVFEAGVTDKEQGSGIGLVVARSLARQHGGDVDLRGGERGGLIAQLALPRTPLGVSS
ncbi:MAG TPA: HAMP domain-containing sensor histidine kinase [Polyangiales bacterium]|nr:HAMP domain-containing sensor histidine kinase [Polyangiales bacterium]